MKKLLLVLAVIGLVGCHDDDHDISNIFNAHDPVEDRNTPPPPTGGDTGSNPGGGNPGHGNQGGNSKGHGNCQNVPSKGKC